MPVDNPLARSGDGTVENVPAIAAELLASQRVKARANGDCRDSVRVPQEWMRGFEVKASQARNDDQRGRLEVGCPGSVRLLPSAFHGPEGLEIAQEVHLRPESRGLQARGMSHQLFGFHALKMQTSAKM